LRRDGGGHYLRLRPPGTRIGILQTGQSPDALRADMGDYPDMFARLLADRGFEFRAWHVEAMEFPKDVHECDGWLITG